MSRNIFYPKAGRNFVTTEEINKITERSVSYLEAGFPVHFAGLTGTGKSTLAMHLAAQFDQPAMLIHGDEETGSSDLVGKERSFRKQKVVDNYISSVLKTEEKITRRWNAQLLTKACKNGYTLIYDEFSRSRPEANNVLLSVLEEGILNLSTRGGRSEIIEVHPNFKAIFTSNPKEYAGVFGAQDALMDRMITIELDRYSPETETRIVAEKADIPLEQAERIVDLTKEIRKDSPAKDHKYTLRSAIKVGKAVKVIGIEPNPDKPLYRDICLDVFVNPSDNGEKEEHREVVLEKLAQHAGGFHEKPEKEC